MDANLPKPSPKSLCIEALVCRESGGLTSSFQTIAVRFVRQLGCQLPNAHSGPTANTVPEPRLVTFTIYGHHCDSVDPTHKSRRKIEVFMQPSPKKKKKIIIPEYLHLLLILLQETE